MSFFDKETKNIKYGGVPFIKLDVAENYVKLKKEVCGLMDNKCITELEDERLKIKAEKNIAISKQEKSSIVHFPVVIFLLSIFCTGILEVIKKELGDSSSSVSNYWAITSVITLVYVINLVNRGDDIIGTRRYIYMPFMSILKRL